MSIRVGGGGTPIPSSHFFGIFKACWYADTTCARMDPHILFHLSSSELWCDCLRLLQDNSSHSRSHLEANLESINPTAANLCPPPPPFHLSFPVLALLGHDFGGHLKKKSPFSCVISAVKRMISRSFKRWEQQLTTWSAWINYRTDKLVRNNTTNNC